MTDRERLLYMREVAVAFAHIAVASDPTLRTAATLELLIEAANDCRPEGARVLQPGLRDGGGAS